ncbi:MAG: hypothetical protein GEV11_13880 [Streptosporangiales bacterium]|nr:hypothetical protein [Streptosporangiales bacterium]
MLEFAGLGIIVAGALVALAATGAFSGIASGVTNATCAVTGTCTPDKPPVNDDIQCVRAPCPGPGEPTIDPTLRPTPPIQCVRAPCGPQPSPRPKPSLSPEIYCFRAPCP